MILLRIVLFTAAGINIICQFIFRDANKQFKYSYIKMLFPRKIKINKELAETGVLSISKQKELIKKNQLAVKVYWITLAIVTISLCLTIYLIQDQNLPPP